LFRICNPDRIRQIFICTFFKVVKKDQAQFLKSHVYTEIGINETFSLSKNLNSLINYDGNNALYFTVIEDNSGTLHTYNYVKGFDYNKKY